VSDRYNSIDCFGQLMFEKNLIKKICTLFLEFDIFFKCEKGFLTWRIIFTLAGGF